MGNQRWKPPSSKTGTGFFRLLNFIKELWPEDEPRVACFEHPICGRVSSYTMVVTMMDPVAPGAGIRTPALQYHPLRVLYILPLVGFVGAIMCQTNSVSFPLVMEMYFHFHNWRCDAAVLNRHRCTDHRQWQHRL